MVRSVCSNELCKLFTLKHVQLLVQFELVIIVKMSPIFKELCVLAICMIKKNKIISNKITDENKIMKIKS